MTNIFPSASFMKKALNLVKDRVLCKLSKKAGKPYDCGQELFEIGQFKVKGFGRKTYSNKQFQHIGTLFRITRKFTQALSIRYL